MKPMYFMNPWTYFDRDKDLMERMQPLGWDNWGHTMRVDLSFMVQRSNGITGLSAI